jgi:hypothetical protein
MIAAAGLAAAIGDPSRFATAPDFMAYLGMVPSEHTSGPKRRIGAITKAGDVHARTLLIEAAHSYRLPARIGRHKVAVVDTVPEAVRVIAWKAQTRLCQRYRSMMARGKLTQVVVTAIARELAGFVWSIACTTSDPARTNRAEEPYGAMMVSRDTVATESEETGQQGQQVTPGTSRSRVPPSQALKGKTAQRARRARANQGDISQQEQTG